MQNRLDWARQTKGSESLTLYLLTALLRGPGQRERRGAVGDPEADLGDLVGRQRRRFGRRHQLLLVLGRENFGQAGALGLAGDYQLPLGDQQVIVEDLDAVHGVAGAVAVAAFLLEDLLDGDSVRVGSLTGQERRVGRDWKGRSAAGNPLFQVLLLLARQVRKLLVFLRRHRIIV